MEIKMSRFDNSPWGFRVHGGIDFGAPLRIQKVSTILAFLCAIKALALASIAYLVLYMYRRQWWEWEISLGKTSGGLSSFCRGISPGKAPQIETWGVCPDKVSTQKMERPPRSHHWQFIVYWSIHWINWNQKLKLKAKKHIFAVVDISTLLYSLKSRTTFFPILKRWFLVPRIQSV